MKRFDYSSVIGHSLICAKLKTAVKTGRTVSAYLLSGRTGIGKKTVCRAFAAALLCENPTEGVACGGCVSCRLLVADSHPDLIWITPPADKKSIGVELVREKLIREAAIRPFTAKRKVFVVESGELMTVEAQNALLKVLEEPPSYAVFIILATARDSLLDTVLSRSLKLQLLPLNASLCESYFNEQYPEAEASKKALAAAFCQGNLGRGERMLADEDYYALYKSTTEQFAALSKSRSALTDMQQFLTENKGQIDDVIDFMLLFLGDCLRLCTGKHPKLICIDQKSTLQNFVAAISPRGLVRSMEAVIQYKERLQKNASFSAAGLELLIRIQEEIHGKGSRNPF